MIRFLTSFLGAALLASCNPAPPPEKTVGEVGALSADATPVRSGRQMVMTGMDLYMHDYEPTGGDVRNPTFWVHADRGILAEDDGLWTLENARVVVYRNDKEDIIVRAANCTFDQKNDVATLRNGLDLRAGTVTMKLEEIQWDNESGVARSRGKVLVAKGGTRLKASAMSLRPADGSFVLTEVSGRLEFDGKEL